MPFTPFHFGPALVVHEIVGKKHFGFWSFTATQVFFDLEPLLNDYSHDHTHIPAFGLIYAICAVALCFRWEDNLRASFIGAFFGSITHLWLDTMYHLDVHEQMNTYGEWNIQHDPQNAIMICTLSFVLFGLLRVIRFCISERIPQRTMSSTSSKFNRIVNNIRGIFKP